MSGNSARPKTALVLAGGGSLGAVQVGMLRALALAGVRPDMVVGSSVGAYNAAYFAADPSPDGVARLEALWCGLRRRDVFPIGAAAMLGFLWRRDFLVSPSGLQNLIEQNLPYHRLEDALVPLHVVATDMLSGEACVLSEGSAANAIVASSAIPAVFPPVKAADRYLVDGAITSNTPVRVAVALGAERLIVLPTGFACALEVPPRRAVSSVLHALTLLIARQLVAELESLDPSIDFAIVPTLCPLARSPYDFSHTERLIEAAAQSTRGWIADGGLSRRVIPGALRPHHH